MGLGVNEWNVHLIDEQTGLAIDDDSGVCNVLTNNDPSEVTLYSDDSGTSASNPITFTNGRIRFFTLDTVTTVDLSILTAKGQAYWIPDVARYGSVQRVKVNPYKEEYVLVIPFQVVGASEAVVDTGFDQLANMLVEDVFLHVTTLGTGAVLDIGNSTDTDGFIDGQTVAATGFKFADAVFTSNTDATMISGVQIRGALLVDYATGVNTACAPQNGYFAPKKHRRANATSGANITYTNTTISSTAGEGYIYMVFKRIRTTAG